LAVGCVDAAVEAVREDNQDHHVGFTVFLVPREIVDLVVELSLD
jgi:hypothetical protein